MKGGDIKKIIIGDVFPLDEIARAVKSNMPAKESLEIELRYDRRIFKRSDILPILIGYLLGSVGEMDILIYGNERIRTIETTIGYIHMVGSSDTARGMAADIFIIAKPISDEVKAVLSECVSRSQVRTIIVL